MRACKQCGLSIGDTATFCPVCGAVAEPEDVSVGASDPVAPTAPEPVVEDSPGTSPSPSAGASPDDADGSDPESEARRCEKTDPSRAAALYRQALVGYLDAGQDPLGSPSARRDVQRVFDRLSLVLKREGLLDEALEEIESASYLGLVDDDECGTKAQREALAKRRDALRRAVTKRVHDFA